MGGTARFFGVEAASEKAAKEIWQERRKRIAIKRFGGIKDDEFLRASGDPYSSQFSDGCGGSAVRFRGGVSGGGGMDPLREHHGYLTSEQEGDRMVLKINRPPRNKDGIAAMTVQGIAWMINVRRCV